MALMVGVLERVSGLPLFLEVFLDRLACIATRWKIYREEEVFGAFENMAQVCINAMNDNEKAPNMFER